MLRERKKLLKWLVEIYCKFYITNAVFQFSKSKKFETKKIEREKSNTKKALITVTGIFNRL